MFNKNGRFETVYEQGTMHRVKIIVDQETGVNYIYVSEGYGAGLTVLLDKDGKPIVTPINK